MKLRLLGAFLALALVGTGGVWYATANASTAPHGSESAVSNQAAFRAAMRKLWTRMVIVDVVAGTPDTDAALARLLQNQTDIGDAVKPYFGDAAGTQLTGLLRQHIVIAGQLLTAAKTGDTTAFATAKTAWYANAHDIAAFLAAANDKWSLAVLDDEMKTHLDQTLAEAVARLSGDWNGDVTAYDAVHVHILHMADTLSDGIIAKFPAAFAH